VVNVITKSGTNSYHGVLFESLRNDVFNAQGWNTLQKERVRRNQFDGSFGGPIKKDRLFFFASYGGLRDRQVAIKNSARVPTALERQGDFSASPFTVRDPLTRAPFPGNRIPASRLDPTAKNILDKYVPAANLPNSFYEARVPSAPRNDDFTAKIDYFMSATHQATGSYFLNTGSQRDVLNGSLPWTERVLSWKQQNFNQRDTWTKSPSSVNVFQLTYVRHIVGRLNTPAISLGDLGSKYQIQGEPALPNINVRTYFQLGTAIDGPRAGSDYYQLRDTFSLVRGRHSLRFGFEGSLDMRVRVLAAMTVAREFDAVYVWGAQTGSARRQGVPEATITAIREKHSRGIPPEDAQIVDFTRDLIRRHRVDAARVQALRKRFGDAQFIELTGTIGYYSMLAMTVNACELEAASGAEVLQM
jgi:hypothetical protein